MDVCIRDCEEDDVQITKVVSAKKPISWVAPSFDSFGFDRQPVQRSQTTPLSKGTTSSQPSTLKSWRKIPSGSQSLIKNASASEAGSRKRLREETQNRSTVQALFPTRSSAKSGQSSELWSDRYAPNSKAELTVHKKKVEEISDWFEKSLAQYSKRPSSAPVLLLTGPPGAGKTACVRVLGRELGLTIQEWAGTSEQAADQWTSAEDMGRAERSQVDTYQSQSQSAVFHNFLLRANKYQALEMSGQIHHASQKGNPTSGAPGGKTVTVVEEMPNIFYRDAVQFHDIIRKYKRCGRSPLVFIMSDSNNNSSGIQKLFPKDLLSQLHITNICMNPVAPTMLVKMLTRVATAEAGKFLPPSTAVIESVAVSSSGDIRSALNTLQFACGKDTLDLKAMCPATTRPKLKKQGSSSAARLKYGSSKSTSRGGDQGEGSITSALGVKDKAVFLFQSVGKILHFKRGDPADHPTIPPLPGHLKHLDRDPLLVDPEEVAFKSQLSGDSLTSFLHENYVEFLSTVEDLERAAEYFSDADCLSAVWMAREQLQSYSVSIATRGFIHSNSDITHHDSPRRNHGWLPLHKSRWFSASKQANENIMSARQLFKGYHWEPEVLCTEILPYISLTNPTLHDTGQIGFVQEMTLFSRSAQTSRTHLERLNEKDVLADEDEEETTAAKNVTKREQVDNENEHSELSSQSRVQALQKDEDGCEEDIEIEEFDDDDDFGDFFFP